MLRMWCIPIRNRFRKILLSRIIAAVAVAVLLCVIRTRLALVMFVLRVEAFALNGHHASARGIGCIDSGLFQLELVKRHGKPSHSVYGESTFFADFQGQLAAFRPF